MLIGLKINKKYEYYKDFNKDYDELETEHMYIYSENIKQAYQNSYDIISKRKDLEEIEDQDVIIKKIFESYKIFTFYDDIVLDDNIVVKFVNNLNDKRAFDLIGQLSTIYENVVICTTFVNNPLLNIHYLICKNKKNTNQELHEYSITSINKNVINLYTYLFTYSITIRKNSYLNKHKKIIEKIKENTKK